MKQDQIITILTSFLVAGLGWFIGYLTALQRDKSVKRRDLRTQYLIEAFRLLEGASNRGRASADMLKPLESAIADIQLLGSVTQVHLAKEFAVEFAAKRTASGDALAASLRGELRMELGLDPVSEPITYLRITQEPG
jgi:hypothetical protein